MAKKELTDEQIIQVEALAATMTAEQIADYFGISRATFFNLKKSNAEIDRRYRKGKAKVIKEVAEGLLADIRDGDKTARIFFLKTQAGWRETNRNEITGPNGGPIQNELSGPNGSPIRLTTKDLSKLSQKELDLLDKIADNVAQENKG